MGRVKSELAWDAIERRAAEEAGGEICHECSRDMDTTHDGLCDVCWAFVNGAFGVGA